MRYVSTAALLLCASLGSSQEPEKILFRLHPTAGHPTHVRMNFHTEAVGKPGTIDMDFVLKEEFKEQVAKGYVWEVTIESADVKGTGEFSDANSSVLAPLVGKTEQYLTNARGQIVSKESGVLRTFGGSIVFPEQAVSVGDSWEKVVATRAGEQPTTYKFVQTLEDRGLKLAVIEAKAKERGPIRTGQPTVYWVNMADGLIVKIDGEGENTSGSVSVKVGIHFDRTYDTDKADSSPVDATKKPPALRYG